MDAVKLYAALTQWYRLIDPPADHADEVRAYREAINRAAPQSKTLLELGSGPGTTRSIWSIASRSRSVI